MELNINKALKTYTPINWKDKYSEKTNECTCERATPIEKEKNHFYCGACGERIKLKTKPKYCCKCGIRINWQTKKGI